MTRILTAIVAVCIMLASVAQSAQAADSPSPYLNEIASAVAGKNVTVHCETNTAAWNFHIIDITEGEMRGAEVHGYAYANGKRAFISPQACLPLRAALKVRVNASTAYAFSLGLLTLVHESLHLRGMVDEGMTECMAFRLAPELLNAFGVPAKITVNGTRVANPMVKRIKTYLSLAHESLPAEYLTVC
ncbi:MAG: hypothetical protein H0U53_11040 [Actinobacteria bacterium]|nr:hypothetical protein [Actinomycetota bacterium]